MIEAPIRTAPVDTRGRGRTRRVLNTGSGPASCDRLHSAFGTNDWREVRLDINPAVKPDLVGTIGDMRHLVQDATFDAIWSSHNIEHLRAYEAVPSFAEFRRVLKPDGFALITCPDMQAICELVCSRGLDATIYMSNAGPITPLDMMFGHGLSIKEGNAFMSHRTGFTEETLGKVAMRAGFREARVARGEGLDLWALLMMPDTDTRALRRALSATPQAFLVESDLD